MVNVAELVAQGKGVGELRKVGVSPADIRNAGFTLEQMHVHLGIHRLNEAGFTLDDYQTAGFELDELRRHFSLVELLRSSNSRYAITQLLRFYSLRELQQTGRFSATDFLQLGNVSGAELRSAGYSTQEVENAFLEIPPESPNPTAEQPPNASDMNTGQVWEYSSEYLNVQYVRLPENEAATLLLHPLTDRFSTGYGYNGSGKKCPRCGRLFVLLEKKAGADDMMARERGVWICDDSHCGMKKIECYTGYGSIFS